MRRRHPDLPQLWLVSDARTDRVLDAAIRALPRGSGVIFRHFHLPPVERAARFAGVQRLCRRHRHLAVLAGSAGQARRAGAVAAYGAPATLSRGPALVRLMTAHSHAEIAAAQRVRADAILLSPVFPTRSHPGARTLGALRFRLLAARAPVPVIALGGMNLRAAKRLRGFAWAAIDGLNPKDS
ncbi:MAG TPA: thiamine phosphate synthase [Novosphingobium sp.]|nr:thiamine phosphate synthase [Novosphingobium sp.]